MDGPVKVTATKAGDVVVQSKKNSVFGYIRVVQTRTITNEDDLTYEKTLSTLIRGTKSRLKRLNWHHDQELPGKIQIIEQMTPFSSKYPDRSLKTSTITGMVYSVNNKPIYRDCFYVKDPNTPDVFIKHDNEEQVK